MGKREIQIWQKGGKVNLWNYIRDMFIKLPLFVTAFPHYAMPYSHCKNAQSSQ